MAKRQVKAGKDRLLELAESAIARRKTFMELRKHVEAGYSMDCFGDLSDVSIEKFLKDYPEEFVMTELMESMRKGKLKWENIGERQANGSCLGNSRSWVYNMINRYKWSDRLQVEAEHKGAIAVNIVSYADQSSAS